MIVNALIAKLTTRDQQSYQSFTDVLENVQCVKKIIIKRQFCLCLNLKIILLNVNTALHQLM